MKKMSRADKFVNSLWFQLPIIFGPMFVFAAMAFHEHNAVCLMFAFLIGVMYEHFKIIWEKPKKKRNRK